MRCRRLQRSPCIASLGFGFGGSLDQSIEGLARSCSSFDPSRPVPPRAVRRCLPGINFINFEPRLHGFLCMRACIEAFQNAVAELDDVCGARHSSAHLVRQKVFPDSLLSLQAALGEVSLKVPGKLLRAAFAESTPQRVRFDKMERRVPTKLDLASQA